jgi:hypothetical protein
MGNQQSSAPAFAQVISQIQSRQAPVPPNPVADCAANKIKANQLQSQLNQANSTVDQCDPSIPLARTEQQLVQENQKFTEQMRESMNKLYSSSQDKFTIGNELADAVKLLKQYENELRIEKSTVEKDATKLEHEERKYRRDFLDNNPTDGVPWHIFGFQTSDDKVMLTFWITALVAFSLLAHVALITLQPNATFKFRAISGTVGVLVALVASYLLITYYG